MSGIIHEWLEERPIQRRKSHEDGAEGLSEGASSSRGCSFQGSTAQTIQGVIGR